MTPTRLHYKTLLWKTTNYTDRIIASPESVFPERDCCDPSPDWRNLRALWPKPEKCNFTLPSMQHQKLLQLQTLAQVELEQLRDLIAVVTRGSNGRRCFWSRAGPGIPLMITNHSKIGDHWGREDAGEGERLVQRRRLFAHVIRFLTTSTQPAICPGCSNYSIFVFLLQTSCFGYFRCRRFFYRRILCVKKIEKTQIKLIIKQKNAVSLWKMEIKVINTRGQLLCGAK